VHDHLQAACTPASGSHDLWAEALGKYAASASCRLASESSRDKPKPDATTGGRQIRCVTDVTAMDPPSIRRARRALCHAAAGPSGDDDCLASTLNHLDDKAARNERRDTQSANHDADSPMENSIKAAADFIESESEPLLDAKTGSRLGDD